MIDIIIIDIPKEYGLILSKDWSLKLNRYFATNWSHLLLPYKGHSIKIKVENECYMNHMVTGLNDLNELIMFSNSILGNIYFDTLFEELEAKLYPFMNLEKKFELLHTTQIAKPHCTVVDTCTKVDSNNFTDIVSSSTNFYVELTDSHI